MSDGLDTLDPHLRDILDRMPPEPGVYLMKDKKGKVVYVGKAASLRARVRSYFNRSGDSRAFVALLGRLLSDIETVVTNNEKEALLLENNLIKQHQPRFNVKLVDDKNYLVLRLATPKSHARAARTGGVPTIGPRQRTREGRSEVAREYPRLEVVRRIGTDGARYFGPYHSATSCRETLRVINRHFKLRTCTDQVLETRSRPCLQYQIKRCDAPCVYDVPAEEYGEQVRDVALFLEGKDDELLQRLRARMKEAAAGLEYETAASVRDQIAALEKTLTEQRVVGSGLRDQDVIGFHREGTAVEIAVLHVRLGKLLGRRTFSFHDQEFPDDEVLSSFIGLYYDLGSYVPDEVLLPLEIVDADVRAEWLRDKKGRKVEVHAPKRGERARLVELAQKNAASSFHTRRDKGRDADEALAKLQRRLQLKRLPRRIECFDISHLQGAATVASMVVFLDGEPAKGEYRQFKVKSVTNDDFAAMYEVLSRRMRRSLKGTPGAPGESPTANEPKWPLPDLLVIDGGKGQLGTAMAALRDVGVDTGANGLDVIGLAKEREAGVAAPVEAVVPSGEKKKVVDRVFLPHIKDPIPLRPNTAELFVLSRIRDEAHRFAITTHRSLRGRRTLRSQLGDIAGVGEKRQRELLRHFGSVKKVRLATVDELAAVPGMSRPAAESVYRFLRQEGSAAATALDEGRALPSTNAMEPAEGETRDAPPLDGPPDEARALERPEIAEDAAAEELAALAPDDDAETLHSVDDAELEALDDGPSPAAAAEEQAPPTVASAARDGANGSPHGDGEPASTPARTDEDPGHLP